MRPIKKPKDAKKEKAKKTESDGCEKDEDDLQEERDVVSANANETMISNSPPVSQRYTGRS